MYKILIITLFFSSFSFAQIDSLKKVYENTKSDSIKIITLLKWGNLLQNNHPDSSIILYNKGLNLCLKKDNFFYKTKRASFFQNIGNAFNISGQNEKSVNNYLNSISQFEELKNNTGVLNVLYNIVADYLYSGQTTLSLKYNERYLKLAENTKSKKDIGLALDFMGLIFRSQGDFKQSQEYLEKGLKIHVEEKDILSQESASTNLAIVHFMQKNSNLALMYFLKADSIANIIGNKKKIALCSSNLGAMYEKTGNDSLAIKYFYKAKKNSEEAQDIYTSITIVNNMSDMLLKTKKYDEAETLLVKNIEVAKKLGNPESISLTAKRLMEIYTKKQDYKNAFIMQKLFILMKDSLNNIETQRATLKKQAKYEYEKKSALEKAEFEKLQAISKLELEKRQQSILFFKQENALNELSISKSQTELKQKKAEAENKQKSIEILNKNVTLKEVQSKQKEVEFKKQKVITYSVSFGLFLVLLLTLFIFRGLRQKQKANLIITQQKIEVESQKHYIEEKHKEITDSINYAERIQRSFIATKEILDENLNDYFVYFKPKDVVSGDFYWSGKLNNGNFAFVTADSTGHGVPGAIMSLLNITSLEKAIETLNEPAEILNATRKTIIERLKKDGSEHGGKDGMDASLTVYDFKTKKLQIAAANNPVWIVRTTSSNIGVNELELIEIKPDKMPVGKHDRDNVSFTQQQIQLKSGDVVYTLTDGFPDQFGGEKGKKFMSKNLKELLLSNAHLAMHEQKQLLEKTFTHWKSNLEQVDDVTVIGIKI
jgi:serine phosphatase RsbU (regulator of sigma subunit)/tetratricopeptide (TPR) repeat protein